MRLIKKITFFFFFIFISVLSEDYSVNEIFFPAVNPSVITPALQNDRSSFTTHREMISFLKSAEKRSSNISLTTIGYSQNKREIPMIIFAQNRKIDPQKITILFQGMVHGDEPASSEALLMLVSILANSEFGERTASSANILIIPRANPDGAEEFKKNTSSHRDINGDFLTLHLPETRALVETFEKYRPEIVIDLHEYVASASLYSFIGKSGVLPYEDILMLYPTHSEVSSTLISLSRSILLKNSITALSKKRFSYGHYYNDVKKYKESALLIGGTSEPNAGRNYYALNGASTLLIESRGRGIGFENFPRRCESLFTCIKAIISSAIINSPAFISASSHAHIVSSPKTGSSSRNIKKRRRTFIDLDSMTLRAFLIYEEN